MTLEELKKEAKEQGYSLVKIPEKVLLNPCPKCGNRKPYQRMFYHTTTGTRGYFYCCTRCGFETQEATSQIQAKKNWNASIQC